MAVEANNGSKSEDTKKKARVPSAKKREIQSKKRNQRNRSYASTVLTFTQKLKTALAKKDQENLKNNLNELYSLLDKGVKKGILTKNKANRTKSRLSHTVRNS